MFIHPTNNAVDWRRPKVKGALCRGKPFLSDPRGGCDIQPARPEVFVHLLSVKAGLWKKMGKLASW